MDMSELNPNGLLLLAAFVVVILATLAFNAVFRRNINYDQVEKFLAYLLILVLVVFAVFEILHD